MTSCQELQQVRRSLLHDARNAIRAKLEAAQNPALFLSFGKDSLVLLHLVREAGGDPRLFWFGNKLPSHAHRIINDWNLTVFSYAPAVRYRVEDTLISEYSVGDGRFPVARDISVDGEKVPATTTPFFAYDADVTFWGYKVSDRHPLVTATLEPEIQLGPTRMVAPLYHFTDEEVLRMIEEFEIPYEPFSDDVMDIDVPEVPLQVFRERFQL
jgi:hypothetical protein